MNDWRAMTSAPRDGSRIIGWFGDRAIIVFWRSGPEWLKEPGRRPRQTGNTAWYWSDGYSRFPEPECWQPQPVAPANDLPWCSFCECRVDPAECKSRSCPVKAAAA